MKHCHRLPVALACLLSLVSGCSKPASNHSELQDRAAAPVRVKTVSVVTSQAKKTTSQPATVHPLFEASIRPRVSGYLTDIKVDIGDVVKPDQELATIDVPEMKEQLAIADAKINRATAAELVAEAGVALADANVTASEARLDEARSDLKSVEAALAAVIAEFERTSDLVDRRSLEARMLDEVRKKRDSERARRAATVSAVGSADAAVLVARAQQKAASAALDAARKETEIDRKKRQELVARMNFATLRAPFGGVVTMRQAEPGNLVGEDNDQQPLFTISQIDRVRVRIAVPERDAAFVNRGDNIRLSFPSFVEQETLTATVSRTTSQLNPNTRMMLVEAELENSNGRLLPGMFGHAEIEMQSGGEMASLPARAVRFTETGDAYVYVVENEEVSRVNVVTGADDGHQIEIVSGLNPSQTVIDAHLQRFTNGQRVRILN